MTDWLIHTLVDKKSATDAQTRRSRLGTLGSAVGIAVNALLAVLKLIVGTLTGSVAVVADAANNLSDAGGSVVSLISIRLAQKPIDREHPFGHGRMEYIGALGVGVIILLMGFELLRGGVEAIISPAPLAFGWVPFGILLASILLKLWLYLFYRRVGTMIDSSALIAAAKDSLSDVMATGAVALSMLIGHFTGLAVDGWMGLIVSLLVLRAGWEVCRDTVDSLLGGKPDPELGRQIAELMLQYDGILGMHDLILHDYGPGRCFASVHAEVSSTGSIVAIHEIIDRAELEIGEKLNIPICIHMDPIETGNHEIDAIRTQMAAYLRTIDPALKLHDFRRVPGEDRINLIFDVVLPADWHEQDALRRQLCDYAQTLDSRHMCVIHFDIDYVSK